MARHKLVYSRYIDVFTVRLVHGAELRSSCASNRCSDRGGAFVHPQFAATEGSADVLGQERSIIRVADLLSTVFSGQAVGIREVRDDIWPGEVHGFRFEDTAILKLGCSDRWRIR